MGARLQGSGWCHKPGLCSRMDPNAALQASVLRSWKLFLSPIEETDMDLESLKALSPLVKDELGVAHRLSRKNCNRDALDVYLQHPAKSCWCWSYFHRLSEDKERKLPSMIPGKLQRSSWKHFWRDMLSKLLLQAKGKKKNYFSLVYK